MDRRFKLRPLLLIVVAAHVAAIALSGLSSGHSEATPPNSQKPPEHVFRTAARDDAGAVAAFRQMIPVIRNPRCINCHSTGDYPRQGDDGHPHAMNVRRGTDGHGVTSQRCETCHQDRNSAGVNMPPGAPNWGLPPAAMPMIWQGLTDGQICEQLKDPKRNANRSIDQIVMHMAEDKLVGWGWNPGDGRAPIPISREAFASKVREWASKGGACPENN